jgi:hypothetical protein
LIEGEIAALAARSIRKAQIGALRESIERMRTHGGAFEQRDAADRDFHVGIAEATGNSSFALVVGALWEQRRGDLWTRIEEHFHSAALREKTLSDHAAIVTALAAHDSDSARNMHRHLRASSASSRENGTPSRRELARARASGRRCASVARMPDADQEWAMEESMARIPPPRKRRTQSNATRRSNMKRLESEHLGQRRAVLRAAIGAAAAAALLAAGTLPSSAQAPKSRSRSMSSTSRATSR